MADELGFGPGNELSWMNTYFSIGTILGGLVSNLIITVLRPRIWLSSCLITWSVFVLALFKCDHAYQFYVLRFFIGVFESAAWPGVMYCLGSWYRKSELARRSGLFVMSGVIGQMFSGYLQAALFTGMHGKGGMSAWRWLFVFDFILAIPVAAYGFVSSLFLLSCRFLADMFRSLSLILHIPQEPSILMNGKGKGPASVSRKRAASLWERWTVVLYVESLDHGRSIHSRQHTLSGL